MRGAGSAALLLLLLAQAPDHPGGAPQTRPAVDAAAQEARLQRAVVLQGLALAEMEEHSYRQAIVHLQELAAILPDNLLPPLNLAICHFRDGDRRAALAALERARALDPDNPRMLYARARILEERRRDRDLWDETLRRFAAAHPFDPRPWYLRGLQAEREGRAASAAPDWKRALDLDPENLVLMTGLLRSAAAAGDVTATSDALDAVEDRLGGFDEPFDSLAAELRGALERGEAERLQVPALAMRNALRPTTLYQIGLDVLEGRGRPSGPMFPQLDFLPPLPKSVQGGADIAFRLVEAGWPGLPRGRLLGPARVPGQDAFLVAAAQGISIVSGADDAFRSRALAAPPAPGGPALRLDVDQDGVNDLLTADAERGLWLFRGRSEREPGEGAVLLPAAEARGLRAVVPLDVDHEGDLDLFVARAGRADLYLRNNGDGTWTEMARELGIAGGESDDSTDAVSADFDDDGDLDLLVCHGARPPSLYLNRRQGALADATADFRLDAIGAARSAVVADFDNDGLSDLLLWGPQGAVVARNQAGLEFSARRLDPPAGSLPWSCAAAADVDNDGDQDVIGCAGAVEPGARLVFARNRQGTLVSEAAGPEERTAVAVQPGDLDGDGDLDLIVEDGEGRLRFLRNDGGSRNHHLRLTLRGKNTNNAKNNTQGLFTRIEVRAGGTYQSALGNGGVNHLGLGSRRQAEVLRVVWTNGVAQTWRLVAADRTLDEEQVLKGSCPMLFTWDGERFVFQTDLMWASPLGMMLDDGSPATHRSARDHVRVPAGALRPAGGDLWLQITEELWEAIYLDHAKLLAVDHPADAEMWVDENFVQERRPGGPAPIHWVRRRLRPAAARDHRGRDVSARVARRDGLRVDDLPLTRYQGLTEGHHLELSFDGVPAGERLRLLLWGWIFPTDTSINRGLSQNGQLAVRPPSLQVRRADGTWRTLRPVLGLPDGKRKCLVVDLTGELPAGRVTLRIPTNMQIYWDAAALAVGDPAPPATITPMTPAGAHLHYRGFSRVYRRSDTGPHLFDYDDVSAEARFRDMSGRYTRYGPVGPLLRAEDDRYVVMNAGDELTLRFDAAGLPPLPAAWVRDWVLYTDGWVKDADINTSFSQTIEPLPYHGMSAYPDPGGHRFPDTAAHRRFLEEYQTRRVSDRPFRDALKGPRAGDRVVD